MGSELRGAIVGAGFFAGFQAEAWRRMSGVRIEAVADLDEARARAFADKWGIPRVYTDVRRLLSDERLDFVDIATRPDSHLALTSLAAAAGVHVICQKPLAPTLEESVRVVRAATTQKVRLVAHENWRWQPWYREARRLLDAGALGRPYYVRFEMRTGDGRGTSPYEVQPYFRDMPKLLLYETAVHFLDTFRFLVGEIDSVYCQTARLNPGIKGEDFALVQLSFVDGAHGVIDANRIAGRVPADVAFGSLVLEGESAKLRVSPDGRLWLTEYGKEERSVDLAPAHAGYRGDSVRATQQHIVTCLRDGTVAESEGEDYLKTTAAVFACYASVQNGRPVSPSALLAAVAS